jgi:hypothetical protein
MKHDFEDFQSELRGKQLEATFDALKVSTSSSSKFGDASKQQLKIWRDVDKQVRTVSYFANSMRVGQHREFPLAMFEQELGFDKSERTKMTLKFALDHERKRSRTGSSILSRSPTDPANTIGKPNNAFLPSQVLIKNNSTINFLLSPNGGCLERLINHHRLE